MNIREKARQAQINSFVGTPLEGDPKVAAITSRIYDGVDAMTQDQRYLLVSGVIGLVKGSLKSMSQHPHPEHVRGLSLVSNALLAVAAYAVETEREALGSTSTGDIAVDDVLEAVRDLLDQAAESSMTDEERELGERINAAVQARVQAGEPFESAIQAELAANAEEVERVTSHKPEHATATVEDSTPSRYDDSAMYL